MSLRLPRHYPLDGAGDRFGLALCLALAGHALLVLGVGFSLPATPPPQPRLELTLAQHKAERAPDRADYLAQFNQQGSGESDQAAKLTTTQRAALSDAVLRTVAPLPSQAGSPPRAQRTRPVLSSTGESSHLAPTPRPAEEQPEEQLSPSPERVTQLAQEIASLEAELDQRRQVVTRKPRVHRLTSLSTRAHADATYLFSWQSRVERMGNRHYPREASERRLNADLRMLVALRPNGSVAEVRILESSGNPALDQAAMKIVHMAGPYEPFPPEMRQRYDRLEIIRTWQFRQNRLATGS